MSSELIYLVIAILSLLVQVFAYWWPRNPKGLIGGQNGEDCGVEIQRKVVMEQKVTVKRKKW